MAAVGDVWLLTAQGAVFGQTIMNTFTYLLSSYTGSATNAQLTQDIIDQVRGDAGGANILETPLRNCLPPEYQLVQWVCQRISISRSRAIAYPRSVPGLHAEHTSAPNQAAVITLQTPDAGRTQQSNRHIGPTPQGPFSQANGFTTNAYNAILTQLKLQMLLNLASAPHGATWTPAIFHRQGALTPTPLTQGYTQSTLRVMRRRTVGVGK